MPFDEPCVRRQVGETLQVRGHPNIFAVGDATDVKEVKLGYLAAAHVRAACQCNY